MSGQSSKPKRKAGQIKLPDMTGDLGRSARERQWRELREAVHAAITAMRQHGALSDAADRLERAVNAMPTL